MKKVLFQLVFSVLLFSCAMPAKPPVYSEPRLVKMAHEDVMNEDFPTKKSVFIKFGTPTNKETFENMENWYFKFSEVSSTSSVGYSSGTGRISQDPMNPHRRSIDRALITNQTQISGARTNSTTVETYVKFWFVNDSVTKWESYGVDYSRMVRNPYYDEASAIEYENRMREWEEQRVKVQKKQGPIVFGVVLSSILGLLVVLGLTT